MKRLLAFLLVAVLIAGAFGTSAFAEPGKNGKVHWKDQLIADWDEMLQEYLKLKDELEDWVADTGGDPEDWDFWDEYSDLEDKLTADSKEAKKFYLALRNHLNNKHYAAQAYVQNTVRVMNQFRERFPNWDVLPFSSIISHKYNFLFDTPPMLAGGRTLVPVRAIVEGLGADVDWLPHEDYHRTFGYFDGFEDVDLVGMSEPADEWLDEEMNEEVDSDTEVDVVKITLGNIEIDLFIDYPVAYVNDHGEIRWEALDKEPKVFYDTTYVPLRFVAETFGLEVTWDDGTIVIDDDNDQDDPYNPTAPTNIARNADEVIQNPLTMGAYRLDVDFDPSDYDVDIRIIDGLPNSGMELIPYYEANELINQPTAGYYLGLAIEVPDEVTDFVNYWADDVVDVEWRGQKIKSYLVLKDPEINGSTRFGKFLCVFVKISPSMVGTNPNLEVKWEDGLDREYFDIHLRSLAFEQEPIEATVIERDKGDVTQYEKGEDDPVGGDYIDFDFNGDTKSLMIFGRSGNKVPFIEAANPLPDDAGYYVGIRIEAPDGFDEEDLEYVKFGDIYLDEDEFDISDSRLVYYLEIEPEDVGDLLELTIKWGPQFVDETIEIRWYGLKLEEQTLVPVRGEDSVGQDPEETGGKGLRYDFVEEYNKLYISTENGRSVAYYDASEGDLKDLNGTELPDGNWVGIEILRPTNYDGDTIKELRIRGGSWINLVLDGNAQDRLWFYYQAIVGDVDFEFEILWADNFEWETIEVNSTFDELALP